jgi:hypothetical protein
LGRTVVWHLAIRLGIAWLDLWLCDFFATEKGEKNVAGRAFDPEKFMKNCKNMKPHLIG